MQDDPHASTKPIGFAEEFQTVDVVLHSLAETRGVDAFALSLIKAERQIRKLVTHLVYQFPCYDKHHIPALRTALEESRCVYFDGFERGFDALYRRTVKELVRVEYDHLRDRLTKATDVRNKVFHGQLTSEYLITEELLTYVEDIRAWCKALAGSALTEFGYDGFARNSFRKSQDSKLSECFKLKFTAVRSYEEFIHQHMERRTQRHR